MQRLPAAPPESRSRASDNESAERFPDPRLGLAEGLTDSAGSLLQTAFKLLLSIAGCLADCFIQLAFGL